MGYSGARGTLIYEKNLISKISCQTPFNRVPRPLLGPPRWSLMYVVCAKQFQNRRISQSPEVWHNYTTEKIGRNGWFWITFWFENLCRIIGYANNVVIVEHQEQNNDRTRPEVSEMYVVCSWTFCTLKWHFSHLFIQVHCTFSVCACEVVFTGVKR